VFRITSGRAVGGGRLEFEVEPADADDEARVLAAVADLGVCNSALRLSGPDSRPRIPTHLLQRLPRLRGSV
ncbi:MAG: hypothetical protein KDC40_16205, partial [Actinobacteria bacterium]|nr:hypothetical protein [Actinomycetota bacterium]